MCHECALYGCISKQACVTFQERTALAVTQLERLVRLVAHGDAYHHPIL